MSERFWDIVIGSACILGLALLVRLLILAVLA